MRTIDKSVIDELLAAGTYKLHGEVLLESSLHFSNAWDDNTGYVGAYSLVEAAGVLTDPVSQDMVYSRSADKMITCVIDDFQLKFLVEGDSDDMIPLDSGVPFIIPHDHCKPSIVEVYYSGVWEVEVWLTQADGVHRVLFDVSDIVAGTQECTISDTLVWSGNPSDGSCFSPESNKCIYLYIDEGGYRVTYLHYESSWRVDTCPWRIMHLEEVQTVASHRYRTNDATAVVFDGNIYFYMTDPDTGAVIGLKRTGTDFAAEDAWSDFFEAVGSDLSQTVVNDSIVTDDNAILMSAQFTRTEFEDNTLIYNLVMRSIDGETFSIDRFTAVSTNGYRLFLELPNLRSGHSLARRGLWIANSNRFTNLGLGYAHASHSEKRARLVSAEVLSVNYRSAAMNGSVSITLGDADGDISALDQLQKEGAKATVYIGYETEDDIEYVQYLTGVVAKISHNRKEHAKKFSIDIVNETQWRMANTSYPYYSELTSRSAVYDDLDKLDNMYVAPGQGAVQNNFYIDWWEATGYAYDVSTEEQTGSDNGIGHNGFDLDAPSHKIGSKSRDLKDALYAEDYPVTTLSTVTAKIYGHGYALVSGNPNSTITPFLICEDANGNETVYTADSLQSTYAKFPKRWEGATESGSEPIDWDFTTIPVGTTIKNVGVLIEGTSDGVAYVSRVEITGASYTATDTALNSPWELQTDGGIKVPDDGQPYVMFSTRPYDSKGFRIVGQFDFTSGTNPNSTGTTKYGLVGLASDAKNLIGAFINTVLDTVELTVVREGEETVLDSDTATILNAASSTMLFEYRGGVFRIYGLDGTLEWQLILEYEWEAADDVLYVEGETQLRHVGIWGEATPLRFKIPSFDSSDCDGIGIIAGETFSVFQALATPGQVKLGDTVWEYSSKSGSENPEGPFQARNTWDWGNYTNIYTLLDFNPGGIAIEFRWYRYSTVAADRYIYEDHLAISDNGHGWIISKTDWQPYIYTLGLPVFLPNRSRWFGANINGNWIGTRNRVWVTPCLTGLELVEGEATYFPMGTYCKFYITDEIECSAFYGANDVKDSTVRDMLTVLARASGGDASFPGDIDYSSVTVTPGSETDL